MDPLHIVVLIAAAVSAFTWVMSLITREHSWVDRLWSIVPVIYVWVFAIAAGLEDARLTTMAILVTMWGARLTFNFARKGGYSGAEDYRWPTLRARMKRWEFEIFNLLFIVLFQNLMLVLIALPALTAYENRATPFDALDVAIALLFVVLLGGETVADQQQWNFHQVKKGEKEAGRTPDPQFVQSGLWHFSRHPNFFFEQAQWWTLYLFGAVALGSILHWSVIGAVLLTLLFIGSTRFTESITLSKYPEYADYQALTSAVIPWPARRTGARATAA
jgi:steroid 5-alpha reductase family enzyme